MDQKLKFVSRLLDGDKMTHVCDEFGISRKTGYKIWNRYKNYGEHAIVEQKRTPYRYANKLPLQIEILILRFKKEKIHWEAPKIRKLLIRKYPDIKSPAISTVHAVLDRNGLVKRRKKTL